jgi:UDP-N-acetylmuramoyl-L-alanyl-D-glutamate--2,6-diaminopimelate ligase
MTMPGRFLLQKTMAQMAEEGCEFCVVETTSEGIKQWRHVGIDYDVAVFTNLSPEHLASHGGSFEKYREAKGKMFAALNVNGRRKNINGRKIDKTIIVNFDDENKDFFLNFAADKKMTYGLRSGSDVVALNIVAGSDGVSFDVGGENFRLDILGAFNVYNALPAIAIGRLFDVDDKLIAQGLAALKMIPGRMEEVVATSQGVSWARVFVDYAHEAKSMEAVLLAGRNIVGAAGKVIVLLGAEGGGRDKAKRPAMGKIAGQLADFIVVSNVDPYDDDPQAILNDIAIAVEAEKKVCGDNLFVMADRRQGIHKALSCAKAGDVVLITGKGAEQSITIGGQKYPWDDRTVVREEMLKLKDQMSKI